jgi:dTDP-4-amino-4,6-dideoxygalactose transaminase
MLDLQAQYAPIRRELLDAVTRVCDSQQFILGPEVHAFEHDIALALGVKHAIGVSSGTDALLISLMALDIGRGDEVVTPTYSFFATIGVVARLGATPVLVDIEPDTFGVDPGAVGRAVTARTRAILPVHLFGMMADMDPLLAVARDAGVPTIEDAAQAVGAEYRGRAAGTLGTLSALSFFPSKNLGAFGDAGLVTTNDDALAERVRLLREHGAQQQYYHRIVGGNFRIDTLQAAVLRVKLKYLSRWTAARQRNAARYRKLFEEAGVDELVQLPRECPDRTHTYNQFVIRVPRRDEVRAALAAKGIASAVYYPVPFHLQECFASLGHHAGDFPRAEAAAQESLALPIYPELTLEQQRYVVENLARALTPRRRSPRRTPTRRAT